MRLLISNLKLIIGFIIGIILASSITVYAYSYFANQIEYTREGTNINTVEGALNDLYSKINNIQFGNTYTNSTYGTITNTSSVSINNLNKGKYICEVTFCLGFTDSTANIGESSTWNPITISGCENYTEINHTFYKSSASSTIKTSEYLAVYKHTKTFIVQSEENISLTASINNGWANNACPIIMDIKCTEIL